MSRFLKFLIIFSIITVAASSVYAKKRRKGYQPPIAPPGVKPPEVKAHVLWTRGNGCPAGQVRAVMSPNMSTVSILFDSLYTELPASPVAITEKKTCSVSLGFTYYGKYRIAIVGSDVRGFYAVPSGSRSTVSVFHNSLYLNLRYRDSMNFTQTFNGPAVGDIDMQSRFGEHPLWSQCGNQNSKNIPFMTINLTIDSQNLNQNEDLIVGIDSLDFSGDTALTYHLIWAYDTKNCPR